MPRRRLEVLSLGRVPYAEAVELQARWVSERRADRITDRLVLLEHPSVITLGTGSHDEHVLLSRDELARRGIDIEVAGRGGDVTFHGPGQLVGYPILDLKPDRQDLHRYLRDLEEVLIRAAAAMGVVAGRVPGLTGVWTSRGKLAAIGVRVSSGWITSHGFALNVAPDLSGFDAIVPCGISDRSVTSLEIELGHPVDSDRVRAAVVDAFATVFDRVTEDQAAHLE